MKTTFITTAGLSLSAMIMSLHPFAQNTDLKNETVAEVSYNMNKGTPSTTDNDEFRNFPADIPFNLKVVNQFNKKILGATNVSWSFASNGTYHVFFKKDGCLNAILFNKNGNIIYLINYISEKQLPSDIKNMITDTYDEYQIGNVAKVSQEGRTIYIVNLFNLNHLIFLRVEGGELEVVNKYNRGN